MKTLKILTLLGSLVFHCLEFIFLTLLFWTIVPILVILLCPCYIFRLILLKIVTPLLHPDWTMMNLRDVFVSEDMTEKKLTSITTFVFDLQPHHSTLPVEPPQLIREVQNLFQNSILDDGGEEGKNYGKKLKSYIDNWLGYPFWKKAVDFSLANHIHLLNGVENGFIGDEENFLKILSPILTQPFKNGMPPWEILVVSTTASGEPNHNNSAKLIFRFHHSLSDGFSFFKLICRHFGGQNDDTHIPQPPPIKKLTGLAHLGQFLWSAGMAGYVQSKNFVLDREWPTWHPPRGQLTGNTHALLLTVDPVPFTELKNIGKKFKVSPTAVLFSAIAGGIHRYLNNGQGGQGGKLPKVMRGHFPWPQPNHPMTGLVNHWTFVSMEFILESLNSVSRLRQMGENFEGLKNSPMPRLVWSFMPLYTGLPNPICGLIGNNRTSTLTLSSFPGPRGPLNFLDKWRVNDMMFWLPRLRGNPSMQFGILSYNGNVRLTLAVDKAIFGEREEAKILAQCIQQELLALQLYHHDKLVIGLPEE